jgi:TolA-binding protein
MFLLAQVDLSHAVTATQDLDINQLAHLSGGNPLMLLALGAVALLGGKKVWDWLAKRQEQQHEQKMEEIKTQKEIASTGHEQCVAKQQDLESQVSSLKDKLGTIEKKASDVEKKSEENLKLNTEALDELEGSVKKIKKKIKKLEEISEKHEESKKGK